MRYLITSFQDSGPFLAFPDKIMNRLPQKNNFKNLGAYLFIKNYDKSQDVISLIDKIEPIYENHEDYRLMNLRPRILSGIIGTSKAPSPLRKSAFNKLEELSHDLEIKPNQTYEKDAIQSTDLTYLYLICEELIGYQNMMIEGFRKLPRDEVVGNALKQLGLQDIMSRKKLIQDK